MMVRSGWNSEYARQKYDVEVGESDLARILTSQGIPLEALDSLSMGEAHDILYYTAEGLARLALGRYDKNMAKQCAEDFRRLQGDRDKVLAKVKARWEAPKPGDLSDVGPREPVLAEVQEAKDEVKKDMQEWNAGWPPQDS